eukprot:1764936-Prorocentrum_lima.AAC.1
MGCVRCPQHGLNFGGATKRTPHGHEMLYFTAFGERAGAKLGFRANFGLRWGGRGHRGPESGPVC